MFLKTQILWNKELLQQILLKQIYQIFTESLGCLFPCAGVSSWLQVFVTVSNFLIFGLVLPIPGNRLL